MGKRSSLALALAVMALGPLQAERISFGLDNPTRLPFYLVEDTPGSEPWTRFTILGHRATHYMPLLHEGTKLGIVMPHAKLVLDFDIPPGRTLHYHLVPVLPSGSKEPAGPYAFTVGPVPLEPSPAPATGETQASFTIPSDGSTAPVLPPPSSPWTDFYEPGLTISTAPAKPEPRRKRRMESPAPDEEPHRPAGSKIHRPLANPPEGAALTPDGSSSSSSSRSSSSSSSSSSLRSGITLVNLGVEDSNLITILPLPSPCTIGTTTRAGSRLKTWPAGEHVTALIPAGGQISVTLEDPAAGDTFFLLLNALMENRAGVEVVCSGRGGRIDPGDEEALTGSGPRTRVRAHPSLPRTWTLL